MTISDEDMNSISTAALNAASSSRLTWEDTNKSSWTDYVAANSSNGELNSTATYQTEIEWRVAYNNIFDESYKTAYEIGVNNLD
jgi:hypothetical protein